MKPHQVREMVNELRDVAVIYSDTHQLRDRISHVVHKYLAVPQEWVGLTEEEIREIDDTCCYSLSSFVRAVEAKLREKNAYGWQSVENPTQYLDDLRGGDAT